MNLTLHVWRQKAGESEGRFVEYGRVWWKDPSRSPPEYLRRFLIVHLAQAGEWELARKVLTDMTALDGVRRSAEPARLAHRQDRTVRPNADIDKFRRLQRHQREYGVESK